MIDSDNLTDSNIHLRHEYLYMNVGYFYSKHEYPAYTNKCDIGIVFIYCTVDRRMQKCHLGTSMLCKSDNRPVKLLYFICTLFNHSCTKEPKSPPGFYWEK